MPEWLPRLTPTQAPRSPLKDSNRDLKRDRRTIFLLCPLLPPVPFQLPKTLFFFPLLIFLRDYEFPHGRYKRPKSPRQIHPIGSQRCNIDVRRPLRPAESLSMSQESSQWWK